MPPESDIIGPGAGRRTSACGDVTSEYFTSQDIRAAGADCRAGSLALLPGWTWPRKYSGGWMRI